MDIILSIFNVFNLPKLIAIQSIIIIKVTFLDPECRKRSSVPISTLFVSRILFGECPFGISNK